MCCIEKGQFGYTRREERLNFISHFVAFVASIWGSYVMIGRAVEAADKATVFAVSLFCAFLVFVFAASSIYHGLPDGELKLAAKKVDHVGICLIICGIYTALIIVRVPFALGIVLGTILWSMALYGLFYKTKNCPRGEGRSSLKIYFLMGFLIIPIFPFLNIAAIAFLLAAAFFNCVGTIFYIRKGSEFSHTAWHLFSICASICDYFAVLYGCELV